MSSQKMKSRGRESSGPAVPESAGEEVVDRLAGLLPAEALQDALAGLAPEEITGPGGLVTQLAGRVLEAALGAELTEHLLDLIYADSTPCAISFSDDVAERVAGVWHRPTVQAAARLDADRLCELEAALRDAGMIGAPIHAYGTLTAAGEWQARERWQAGRPQGAFGGPPRLARPYQRAGSVFARPQDRACPNCARMRRLPDPPTDQTLGGSARTRRGRLLLFALRGALDDLPRAHRPRRGVRPACRAGGLSPALALSRRLAARRRARASRPPPSPRRRMTPSTTHQPDRTRRMLGVSVAMLLLAAICVSVLEGVPRTLPGVALGSPVLLHAERALALVAVVIAAASVLVQAGRGRLPVELSTTVLRYEAEAADDAAAAVAELQAQFDDLVAIVDALADRLDAPNNVPNL
jgi:hypothetical protein